MPRKSKTAATQQPPKKQNRIWIELDRAIDETHAKLQCELANKVIAKLGVTSNKFFVTNHKGDFNYCFGGDYGYKELVDRGEWFDLDYLSTGKS